MPVQIVNNTSDIKFCERCGNYFELKPVYNIRPYNPSGERIIKKFVDQNTGSVTEKEIINVPPLFLCKNCRQRIYDWITGATRKLDIAPDKMKNKNLSTIFGD